jgi:uncharacterized membrane protein YagU involved in acid resistance
MGVTRKPGRSLEQIAEAGILAGIVAAVPMALFAMIASATYQGRGFFTPVYHIAFVVDPTTWPTSVELAEAGDAYYFRNEPFVFGMAMHIAIAAIFGLLFALLANVVRPRGRAALAWGVGYGLIVMLFMTIIVLPIVGSAVDAGEPISRMASNVGWFTFGLAHAIFGCALGLWVLWRPQDVGLEPAGSTPTTSVAKTSEMT